MARKNATKARLAAHDSLSNLAASLGAGKDKAANDAFFVAGLAQEQIEAMYRGDWLARKIVDIVPYDSIREWREWAGDRTAVAAIERAERQLGLRKAVQRAMVLGRLYGGGAIIVGTGEDDAAELARPLYPEAIGPGGVRFLHAVSRWQLAPTALNRDPLDPFYGEPSGYVAVGPERGELLLHPSRVIRFLGNPLPDPLLYGTQLWSDSVLQSLYDAIHAVAVTGAGATSLVHEAKVDIVTVPGLSEHLSNAATTAQLSARFAYAAAMKSINNLLLLGDGETWTRQSVDFAGLPEMVRTFLQVAAGAADIPVTRLLGQSPAGLSATGDSDTRNYYDMIAARQELDLRPQLERLDALVLRAAGVDPASVSFAFRPLWQLSAAEKAGVALQKAQASAVYARLNLWPDATTAALVRSQLLADGVYPGAAAAFTTDAAGPGATTSDQTSPLWARSRVADFDPSQPRDPDGRWSGGGARSAADPGMGSSASAAAAPAPRSSSVLQGAPGWTLSSGLSGILGLLNPIPPAAAQESDPDEETRTGWEPLAPPEGEASSDLTRRYQAATQSLAVIAPRDPALERLSAPGAAIEASEVEAVEAALRQAVYQRTCDVVRPDGRWIGEALSSNTRVRTLPGGLDAAREMFDTLSEGGDPVFFEGGSRVTFPGGAGSFLFRPVTSSPESPAVDGNVPVLRRFKVHFR